MKLRAVAATAIALAVVPASAAVAAPKSSAPRTLASGLVGPLHLSVGPGSLVTVSEEFAGMLTNVTSSGAKSRLYAPPADEEWDVAGTDYQGGTLYVLQSKGAGPDDPRPLEGSLLAIKHGRDTTVTDQIGAYETAQNPDQVNTYGLSAADAAAHPGCVAQLEALGVPARYAGVLDSHPYAVKVVGNTAYVADAGINAVLAVNLTSGAIRTLTVLPPRPVVVSPGAAQGLGVPDCAGLTYSFEGVPTDVEMGPDGSLYVSSLPGGPEDASFGARGAVFKVDPTTGATTVRVDGLVTPTGIALDGSGNLYAASLFGPGIFKVPAGSSTPSLYMEAGLAADVEVSGSTLYATTGALAEGMLVSKRL